MDQVFDGHDPALVGQAMSGARTVFFEDSSHALHLDEPVRLVSAVHEFLQERPS